MLFIDVMLVFAVAKLVVFVFTTPVKFVIFVFAVAKPLFKDVKTTFAAVDMGLLASDVLLQLPSPTMVEVIPVTVPPVKVKLP